MRYKAIDMSNPIIYGLIVFFHELFTAIWIGGLIFLSAIFFPVLRSILGKTTEMKKISLAVQDRLWKWVYGSIIGLFLTGILMNGAQTGGSGFFSFNTPYTIILSIKHILTFMMVVIGVIRSRIIHRQYRILLQSTSPGTTESTLPPNPPEMIDSLMSPMQTQKDKQEKKLMLFLLVNTFLGITVLLLSGVLAIFY